MALEYATKEDIRILTEEMSRYRKELKEVLPTTSGNINIEETLSNLSSKQLIEELLKKTVDAKDAMKILGITRQRLYQIMQEGKLTKITNPGVKVEFFVKDIMTYKYNFSKLGIEEK